MTTPITTDRPGGFLQRPAVRRFRSDPPAVAGLCGIALLLLLALAAPLIANGRPLLLRTDAGWSAPFWRTIFAPDSPEYLIEQACTFFLPRGDFALGELPQVFSFGGERLLVMCKA